MAKEKKWICTVCGYIHTGDNPPDYCPLCGATKDLFEPYLEPAVSAEETLSSKWRCLNCEYIHNKEELPDACPVCGAANNRFEKLKDEKKITVTDNEIKKIIIAGAGIAGISAAKSVREILPQAEITIISKEKNLPYYRLNLTRYLAGEINANDLLIFPEKWYNDNKINLLLNTELCNIDTINKKMQLKGKPDLCYDKLILTIGSHAFTPPFHGNNKENVSVLRTKNDADFVLEQSKYIKQCLIIGGGLLGLETAAALAKNNIPVNLLEGHGWLLPRQLNLQAGNILEEHVNKLGIRLYKNARVKTILGDEKVRAVQLENGQIIEAELVIVSTGIRSNSYIARLAGINVNKGILVNNNLETSCQHIYAAGDVAEHQGVVFGTWGPAQFQGTAAGINAAGGKSEFGGISRSNMLKVLGYDLFSIGQINGEDASYRAFDDKIDDNYYYFLFRDSHLVGSILLNETSLSAAVKNCIEKKIDFSFLQTDESKQNVISILKYLEKL